MAEKTTVARPYAKAIFSAALEQDVCLNIEKELAVLSSIVQEPVVYSYVGNGTVSWEDKANKIIAVFDDVFSAPVKNLIRVLAAKNRLKLILDIYVCYKNINQDYNKELAVFVTSARALSDKSKGSLIKSLSKHFGLSVNATFSIDDTLIGGVVVKAKDLVIDWSTKGRLRELEKALVSNDY